MTTTPPNVLCMSGLDPSGGAGICADIETLASLGVHTLPIITTQTIQNLSGVEKAYPVPADLVIAQLEKILDELPFAAIKVGLIVDESLCQKLATFLSETDIPVIMDPVLISGTGMNFSTENLVECFRKFLIPASTIITPNQRELMLLTGQQSITLALDNIHLLPCDWILVTGTDNSDEVITHNLFHQHKPVQQYEYTKLDHIYHGSGCTLASSIAGYIANGESIQDAIGKGLDHTYQALLNTGIMQQTQQIPDRVTRRS